jgi:hypothetical protein
VGVRRKQFLYTCGEGEKGAYKESGGNGIIRACEAEREEDAMQCGNP